MLFSHGSLNFHRAARLLPQANKGLTCKGCVCINDTGCTQAAIFLLTLGHRIAYCSYSTFPRKVGQTVSNFPLRNDKIVLVF